MKGTVMNERNAHIKPPSKYLLALEWRGFAEHIFTISMAPLLLAAPNGDGHPVLVLPGLAASDSSTLLLRTFLQSRGYAAEGWSQGVNFGPRQGVLSACARHLEAMHRRHQKKVSIVGWSLGGVFARNLARSHPQCVRQVITLGSPISGPPHASNAGPLFEWLSGMKVDSPTVQEMRASGAPVPVPSTSVFSMSDGVVPWESSIQTESPTAENVCVPGSHMGLGASVPVLWLVANRLAQPENMWRPYAPAIFESTDEKRASSL